MKTVVKNLIRLLGTFTAVLLLCNICFSAPVTVFAKEEKFEIRPVGTKETSEVIFNYADKSEMLSEMKQVAENDSYSMYIHEKNLSVALVSKKDGKIYTTNPFNAAKQASYNGNNKKIMDSQVVINYSDSSGKAESLWSSSDCAELGQFEISPVENGVNVRYSIGVEKTVQLVPQTISAEDFEKILGVLEEEGNSKGARRLKVLYKADKTETGESVYISRKLSEKELAEVEEYFISAGYTEEMFEADSEKYDSENEAKYFPNFQLDLEYRLSENGFTVNIPSDSIRYDKEKFELISIKLLEFFGASDSQEDNDGFIFLPDGSGAIMPYSNKNDDTRQAMISGKVYGMDNSVTKTVEMFTGKQYYLPVFGLTENESGYFALITNGAATATISAYAGNIFSKYYTVFPVFELTTKETMELEQKVVSHGSQSEVTVYDENVYDGDLRVEYNILNGEQASLTGMAEVYRQYLFDEGMNSEFGVGQDFLTLETIGTLNYDENLLGFRYNAEAELTTFEDTQSLLGKFFDSGISDISLMLNAWRKNGLDCIIANRFDPSGALGGKSGFDDLYEYCKKNNVDFYPDIDLVNVKSDRWFDGFNPVNDATRLLNKKYGGKRSLNLDTGLIDKENFSYALSPSLYSETLKKFLKKYNKKYTDFGLSTIGKELNSNFRKGDLVNRAQTEEIIRNLLADASEKNRIMVEGANSYCLPYADFLVKLPLSGSEAKGTVSVPFLQILLNGYVKYSSEEINFESNYEKAILECIESATSPHFVLAAQNIIKIKQTDYTQYYSVDTDVLFDTITEYYNTYVNALEPVKGSRICGYDILANDVVKVSYDNGYCIIVNYTDGEFVYNGETVEPMSSATVKEAGVFEQ